MPKDQTNNEIKVGDLVSCIYEGAQIIGRVEKVQEGGTIISHNPKTNQTIVSPGVVEINHKHVIQFPPNQPAPVRVLKEPPVKADA